MNERGRHLCSSRLKEALTSYEKQIRASLRRLPLRLRMSEEQICFTL